MMRIALVPLDSRPCNIDYPARLADFAGVELIQPPLGMLGRFRQPGQSEAILDWLDRYLPEVDALVVSTDMIAYGGLVPSRSLAASPERVHDRIDRLALTLDRYKGRTYAFTTVMRSTITADSDQTAQLYRHMALYSELAGLVEETGDPEAKQQLARVCTKIPHSLLEQFLRARSRNHEINQRALELLGFGLFDYLCVPLEDCAPHGLHRQEERSILQRAQELGVTSLLAVHPGADEAAQMLVARAILERLQIWPTVEIDYPDPEAAARIAPYEDRAISQTTDTHLQAMGLQAARDGADLVLFVLPPTADLVDFFCLQPLSTMPLMGDWPPLEQQYLDQLARIEDAARRGVPFAIADGICANGGHGQLVARLVQSRALLSARAYAGWNTAGNCIGTALAFGAVGVAVTSPNEAARIKFLLERLLDDYCYQAVVRKMAVRKVREELGASIFDLGETKRWHEVEEWVAEAVKLKAGILLSPILGAPLLESLNLEISLPWPRLFEVRVRVEGRTEEDLVALAAPSVTSSAS